MTNKGVYRKWRKKAEEIRFVYKGIFSDFTTPSTPLTPHGKTYFCGEFQSSYCRAYCCSLDIELSPFEIAVISHTKNLAPAEFVRYCDNVHIERPGETVLISPLFAFKQNNSTKRCAFNNKDFKCDIYNQRPITCRAYPVSIRKRLYQRMSCAGYKRGHRISEDEFVRLEHLARMQRVTAGLEYEVNTADFTAGREEKIIADTLHGIDIPFDRPVAEINLEKIYSKLKERSDLEHTLKRCKMDKEEFLTSISAELAVRPEVPKPEMIVVAPAVVCPQPEQISLSFPIAPVPQFEDVKPDETIPPRTLLREKPEIKKEGI